MKSAIRGGSGRPVFGIADSPAARSVGTVCPSRRGTLDSGSA